MNTTDLPATAPTSDGVTPTAPSINEEHTPKNAETSASGFDENFSPVKDDVSAGASHVNEGFQSEYKNYKPPSIPPPIYTELPPLLPPSFPPLTNKKIREACYEYVEDTCCYGSRAIRDMIFTSIISDVSLHYKLESLGEKRQTANRTTPFYGQQIDGPENGRSPGPWEIIVERPTVFRDGKYKMEIPHSAYVKTCWNCNGRGTVTCSSCGGDGWNNCSCSNGRDSDDNTCSRCNGSGRNTCWSCSGSGRVTCSTCNGHGKLKHYQELIVTWKIHAKELASNHMNLPAELIQEASGSVVFREKNAAISPISHTLDPKINEASHRFIEMHKTSFLDEFILFQRQTLRAIPMTKITYNWRRKEGEFYVYSEENKVYFEDYPQKCCLCICC